MGYYIETPSPVFKAEQLIKQHGAVRIPPPRGYDDIPHGQVPICVVQNGMFDAAGIAYNDNELEEFKANTYDRRPRTWLTLPREKVLELNSYVEGVLQKW